MKPPEEVKREFVRQWLRKAEADLAAAQHPVQGDETLHYAAAFHAQQGAEKLLEAVLVWHQTDFPKTHDLMRLLDLVRPAAGDLAKRIADVATLTPYAVEARYPGDLPERLRRRHGKQLRSP